MTENEIIIANLKAEVIKLKIEVDILSDYDKYQPVLDKKIAGLTAEIKKLEVVKVN